MFTRTFHSALIPSLRRATLTALVGSMTLVGCQPPPPANPGDAASASVDAEPKTEDALPSAEEVIEKAIAAIGGRSRLDSIQSYYSESIMEIQAQNMSMTMKTWWKQGNFYNETDMPGYGVSRVWRNGDEVWSDDPINGRRKLEGKEARQTERSSSLSMIADWKKFFSSAETTGRRNVGDATLVDVVMKSDDGDEVMLSFDASDWLLRQTTFEQESPMGKMPVTVELEDYEDYDGLKHATRSVMNMAVVNAVTTVTAFEINPQIDDAKFKPDESKKDEPKKAESKKDEPKKAKK